MSMDEKTGKIVMTRGDTERALITLKMDGEIYDMKSGDEIHFGVKANYRDAACLIRKTYTDNPFILSIEPEDTQNLDFGNYVYDMEIVMENGYTFTFANKKKLKLTEEVYTKEPDPEPEPEPEPDPTEEEVDNDG